MEKNREIYETKNWFFEIINKIDTLPYWLVSKRKERRHKAPTSGMKEVTSLHTLYWKDEQFYADKFNRFDEMGNSLRDASYNIQSKKKITSATLYLLNNSTGCKNNDTSWASEIYFKDTRLI